MGIKFHCPNGHKLNVKAFLAGKRGICPDCGVRFRIPHESGGVAELVEKKSKQAATAGSGAPSAAAVRESSTPVAQGSPAVQAVQQHAAPAAAAPVESAVPIGDPLAEAPQAVWYVRPRSGGQYGPASVDVMRSWISDGRVAGDSLVWREGWADWRQASEVLPQCAGSSTGYVSQGLAAASLQQAGAPQQPGGAESGVDLGIPADGRRSSRPAARRKSSGLTAAVVVMLTFAAIILAGVLVYVLTRPIGEEESSRLRNSNPIPFAEQARSA